MMVVVESPLRGKDAAEQQRNFRYLLWCLRALWEVDGHHGIASHLICPWFMDDSNEVERSTGIGWDWVWQTDAAHWFMIDLGSSGGMNAAYDMCESELSGCEGKPVRLSEYAPDHWAAFKRGEWPPHTAGFELAIGGQP